MKANLLQIPIQRGIQRLMLRRSPVQAQHLRTLSGPYPFCRVRIGD